MNLRNKKTGKLYEWSSIMAKKNRKSVKLIVAEKEDCKFTVEDDGEIYYYDSFDQMCEEWETIEDPRPKEPLIKDKKVRKTVRAWADMNKIEKAGIQKIITEARGLEDSWYQITGQDKNGCLWKIEIHASYSETVSKEYKENMITIAELCGEEEE